MDDYSDFVCTTSVKDASHFSFYLPRLTKDTDIISGVKVKVWYYDNANSYEHRWFDGEKNSDGTWSIVNDGWDCSDAEEVNYQLLAVTDNGVVNLGQQQVMYLSDSQ